MNADELFLRGPAGRNEYRSAMRATVERVLQARADRDAPYSGASPDDLAAQFEDPVLPEAGDGLEAVLDAVAEDVLDHSVDVADPRCAAHLHCPPTVPGLAAEAAIAATNQSLDSFDQAPAATVLEERVVDALCDLFDLPPGADGVFTSGGTQSNFQALLLARDRYCAHQYDTDVQQVGLPETDERLCVVCSEDAHFTTEQAAHHLGLGEDAVVPVRTDEERRLDPVALAATLDELGEHGADPFAIVGTAGTTDVGAIDPLPAIADLAAEYDCWFHVDGAYGGAIALSDRHEHLLAGVERADSVAIDFHKLCFQPIGCGALLLADAEEFRWMARTAAYLNPEAHENAGVPNLVAKSVQTTRRFDALKPYVTFQTLGRTGLADLVDATIDLADDAAALLGDADDFELLADPTLGVVPFRYRPRDDLGNDVVGRLNAAVRRRLLADGRAIVARTEVDGVTSLKLTLLNPTATVEDVAAALDAVRECGQAVLADQEVVA